MAVGARHRARIAALQALYEADSSRHAPLEALKRIAGQERLSRDAAAFATDLIQEVLAQQDETDRIIAEAAPAWPVEQLSPVDRNILRLAIREMLGPIDATFTARTEIVPPPVAPVTSMSELSSIKTFIPVCSTTPPLPNFDVAVMTVSSAMITF